MPKRLTQEDFIRKAKEKYRDKFTYDKVNFINTRTKVIVTCCIHGDLEVEPKAFLSLRNKGGCKYCAKDAQRRSVEEFIKQAKQIHGDKYDYSKVSYINSCTKVLIKCNVCNKEFWQTPNIHLRAGCPCCSGRNKTTEEFIKQAKQIHGDKYDYSETLYINTEHKIKIRCRSCNNIFEQFPSKHLKGQGCPFCNKTKKIMPKSFLERAREIHGDKYDYSKVSYINRNTKVCIICSKHGEFWIRPSDHLNGQGCPDCKTSKGENKIKSYLDAKQIKYEHNIECLEWLAPQKPDFYLPDYNLIIEYDGEFHYKLTRFKNAEETLKKNQRNDARKNQLCEEHKVEILRIPYWEFNNIENILEARLFND